MVVLCCALMEQAILVDLTPEGFSSPSPPARLRHFLLIPTFVYCYYFGNHNKEIEVVPGTAITISALILCLGLQCIVYLCHCNEFVSSIPKPCTPKPCKLKNIVWQTSYDRQPPKNSIFAAQLAFQPHFTLKRLRQRECVRRVLLHMISFVVRPRRKTAYWIAWKSLYGYCRRCRPPRVWTLGWGKWRCTNRSREGQACVAWEGRQAL